MRKIVFKCPHCGFVFPESKTEDGKTPKHNYNGAECPGVGLMPRSAGDARALGKDVPETRRA
jgi:rubredoxin